nr:MAG TPA: hypothetical protein [Caudoviricetes sp.]
MFRSQRKHTAMLHLGWYMQIQKDLESMKSWHSSLVKKKQLNGAKQMVLHLKLKQHGKWLKKKLQRDSVKYRLETQCTEILESKMVESSDIQMVYGDGEILQK